MSTKTLTRVSVSIAGPGEEPVAALLENLFAQTPCIQTDFETGSVQATVYLPAKLRNKGLPLAELKRQLQQLRADGLDIGTGRVSLATVRQENWAESWKRHFPPLEIGARLLVKPPWSRRPARKGQAVVVLNPGLSFGTGQHPTTRYCLEQLARWRDPERPQAFMDIGTGSGILAIAAAKLGYKPVAAFDNDPEAVRIADRNAGRNRVAHKISLARRDLTRLPAPRAPRFEVICANLVYDLLLSHKLFILAHLKTAGVLILAGLLRSQFAEVARAYCREGLTLVSTKSAQEWQSGSFQK